MSTQIILTIVQGSSEGEEFVFEEKTECVVGRADCDIYLPRSSGHLDVSRRHCLFEIDPPLVRVRDLGSLHGTFVNGEKIGQRSSMYRPASIDRRDFPAHELKDGDEVQIGESVIRVGIRVASDVWDSGQVVAAYHR